MFDNTLLDSSMERAPVLAGTHWIVSIGVGVLGYLAWYFGISTILGPPDTVRALVVQSVVFGGIPLMLTALMLSYIIADCRHLQFNPVIWIILTLLLSVVGFLFYLTYSANKTKNWKRATMPIAYIIDGIVIGCMVLYPLIYTQGLPKAQLMTSLAAPPPPPPPPPPAPPAPKVIIRHVSLADIMKAPTVIPKTIKVVKDQPEAPQTGVVGGVPGGVPGGSMGGVLAGVLGGGPPPPPPPKAKAPSRITVGGQVEAAKLIFGPKPEYPQLAKMARIQGVVRLEALISKDGTIKDLKVMSGHPLLVKSAIDAVSRWRYQPTLLNGDAVEVATEIDVNFTLAE
ncbi:MAG TPA: energy transducer TonB [Terriglobia bacterium]|nr:energy transducer TonB [Terriglobia bacterium]